MRIRKIAVAFAVIVSAYIVIPAAFAQKPLTQKEKELYYGIKAVATPAEFREFEKISGRERVEWLRIFWAAKDPTPTTPENEFYDEHQRRVAYAAENFHTSRYGYLWDDRGEIYVRYGEPDERNLTLERHYNREEALHSAYDLRDALIDPIKYRLLIARKLINPERAFGGEISANSEEEPSINREPMTLRRASAEPLTAADIKRELGGPPLEFTAFSGEV